MPHSLPLRPTDATLSVTKAARLLGVHPNTVRAWSDAGRLRYYRINPRGDRRYRLGDLQRFLSAAQSGPVDRGHGHGATTRRAGQAAHSSGGAGAAAAPLPIAAGLDDERFALDLAVVRTIVRLTGDGRRLDVALEDAAATIRDGYGHHLVAIWEAQPGGFVARAVDGPGEAHPFIPMAGADLLARAMAGARGSGVVSEPPSPADPDARPTYGPSLVPAGHAALAAAIRLGGSPWGVLLVVGEAGDPLGDRDGDLIATAADALGTIVAASLRADVVTRELHRADAVRRVTGDIGSRLDIDEILSGLVDHMIVLFGADRGAVFLRRPSGEVVAKVSRGLSPAYLDRAAELAPGALPLAAYVARRPLSAIGYRNDRRVAPGLRASIIQEGFDTVCTAPLLDGSELLGLIEIHHDQPHDWTDDDLETVAALSGQAAIAIKTAQNFTQMARWAAQLQSIQQLGVRLSRLSSVHEIGLAIATELRQLIDYHNARVYRRQGDELVPIAMAGHVGEYSDETAEQLRVHVGEGITGWVAEHRLAVNLPDAAKDPRADTVPGTEADLDESMLLAPMLMDDQVIGVLVLSKLGLHQFGEDDLRLLVIYASFAAQAMSSADATERLHAQWDALERQVRSQRELLRVTESLLTTYDAREVLEGITDRLGSLIACDNIALAMVDPASGLLTPLAARGVHAELFLKPGAPVATGVATWVVEHSEALLILDERADPRVEAFRPSEGDGPSDGRDGCLIVVPLRGRAGATGVVILERLGPGAVFGEDEFELVQLFAAQVSIALDNAEAYRVIEVRARTDDLTGLLNHGTFEEWLARHVAAGEPFSLIMLDLDDFRDVNNAHGHQAGDGLLRDIAKGLLEAGRESDLIFRYGGDEFAFLLPRTDEPGALRVAERAREAVASAGGLDAGNAWEGARVTASIGVATFPLHGTTAESVLLAADRACFAVKHRGRDGIATAGESPAQAELSLHEPTPVDPPSVAMAR